MSRAGRCGPILRFALVGAIIIVSRLASSGPVPWSPTVASDGNAYMVCWIDHGFDPSPLDCARIEADGTIGIAPRTVLSRADNFEPSIAYGAGEYVILYGTGAVPGSGPFPGVTLSRISVDAQALDTAPIVIGTPASTGNQGGSPQQVAFDGSQFLVVWNDVRGQPSDLGDIYAARVLPNGTVRDPAGFPVFIGPAMQYRPTVIFDGTNFIVAWSSWRADLSASDVFAARVTSAGTVLDSNGVQMLTGGYLDRSIVTLMGSDGVLVSWNDANPHALISAHIDTSLNVLASGQLTVPDQLQALRDLAFAATPSVGLLAWGSSHASRISPSGSLLDASGISVPSSEADYQSLASNGNGFLLAWTRSRQGDCFQVSGDLYVARVANDGTVLDPNGIALVLGDPVTDGECPIPDAGGIRDATGGPDAPVDASRPNPDAPAGISDAGANAAAGSSDGCDCHVAGRDGQGPTIWVTVLVCVIVRRLRRRSTPETYRST